jgi:DNA-binding response OmpR family regulator
MVAWNTSTKELNMQAILVITTNNDLRNAWTTFIQEKNYRVILESDLKNGLQTAKILTPALILVDLDLPKNEQIEYCKKLRATTNGSLILLTPQSFKQEISAYYQAGVDEIITTPSNPLAVLIRSISRLARQEWLVPRKEVVQLFV